MRAVFMGLLLLGAGWVGGQPAAAEVPPSGLYEASHEPPEGGPGTATQGFGGRVARADAEGGVWLGRRLASEFGEASVVSVSNDNHRCRLELAVGPVTQAQSEQHMAVVVAGRCLMVSGHSDPDEAGVVALSTVIEGRHHAEAVAAELGVASRWRTHPGYALAVSVAPARAEFRVNEPVELVMTITNAGGVPVRFIDGGQQRGPRNNQFAFIATKRAGHGEALPDTGDPTNFGGKGTFQHLGPGETFVKEARLTDWFAFTEPGTYRVTAVYEMELFNEGFDHPPLWDDLAAARCMVVVGEGDGD
ncbi:MAG: hypothetical protein AAF333_14840 [Planctomycetota bacterium]